MHFYLLFYFLNLRKLQNLGIFNQNEVSVCGLTFKFTKVDITSVVAGKMIALPSPFKNKHIITLASIEGTAGFPGLHVYGYNLDSYRVSVPSIVTGGTLTIYGCSIGF